MFNAKRQRSAPREPAGESTRTETGIVRRVRPDEVRSRPRAIDDEPSTMVRVSSHGILLAERGQDAERLADAAAYIHGLATSIAADLGCTGRASVHVQGGARSLLVGRSEVNDIAAAFGPTRRLASLLAKLGFR